MSLYLKSLVLISLLVAGFSSLIPSCDQVSAGYVQTDFNSLENRNSLESEIERYTEYVTSLLPKCKEEKSLVYSLGDYSFYVTKFTHKGKTLLYVENGESREQGDTEKKYYVSEDLPVMMVQSASKPGQSQRAHVRKVFFKSGIPFYTEQPHSQQLKVSAYQDSSSVKQSGDNYLRELARLENALKRKGHFDLTFERIVECPQAKYLVFSKGGFNSYRAPVKVEKTDEFIKELSSNPMRYEGEKLDIAWNVNKSHEAVYRTGRMNSQD